MTDGDILTHDETIDLMNKAWNKAFRDYYDDKKINQIISDVGCYFYFDKGFEKALAIIYKYAK